MMPPSFKCVVLCLLPVSLSISQPLSTSIYLSDWGFENISSIRMGQLSIINTNGQRELKVESLYDDKAFTTNATTMPPVLQVSNPNGQFINLLGGASSTYAGKGAKAEAQHTISVDRIEAVRISYSKNANGYCGYWMHLYNSAAPPGDRHYLNSTSYEYLLVAIRGQSGTERVMLKFSDERLNDREDAAAVGECGQWIPSGHITSDWQLVRVPLRSLPPSLHRNKLASLVFEPLFPLDGEFEVGPVWFSRNPESVSLPLHRDPIPDHDLQRALWVWDTKEIIARHGEDSLLKFLTLEKFDNIFLALPYDPIRASTEIGMTIDSAMMEPLVQKLNAAGIKVHALIGDKDFILPGKKEFVRNSIQNIVQYNTLTAADRRFFGIHLDVEPYLVPGFNSPARSWYLGNFVAVMKECSDIAHKGGLRIGADVPPWYDNADEVTHQPLEVTDVIRPDRYVVISETGAIPLYRRMIDLFDNITLMDYRTDVEGDNGIVLFAIGELEYAEEKGKEVFVGLETHPLPDETILTFRDPRTKGTPTKAPVIIITTKSEYETEFTYISSEDDLGGWLKMKTNREMYFWPVFRTTEVPSSQSTFAGSGIQHLRDALQKSEPLFRRYRSFAGFAIHEYRSYLKLVR